MNIFNRNTLLFVGALVLGAVLYYFADIVTYILIAWVLSMLGRPLVNFFQRKLRIGKRSIGSGMAAFLTILVFYFAIAGLILMFVPTIVGQARNLANVNYNTVGEKLQQPFAHLDQQMHQIGLLDEGESLATRTQKMLIDWFKPALLGDFLESFLSVAGNVLVTVGSVTFILFFFLKDDDLFEDIIHALVPNNQEEKVRQAIQTSSSVLTRYFRGLSIQILAFCFMLTVILWLFGIQNGLLIGAFGGIFNVIPYVGPILGMAFGAFITVSSHLDLDFALLGPMLLKVAITFFSVQMIDNNVVGPMIMSKSVKAHPLEIFIVTLAAAKLGGVVGMVIGIPVYTILRVVAREFFSGFKIVQRLTDHLEEEK